MEVTILEQKKVSGMDVSITITVKTERGELSKAEVLIMMRLLQEGNEEVTP